MHIPIPDCAHPPIGSESLRARKSASDPDSRVSARSRRDVVRTVERVESTVDGLLSNTTTAIDQLESRPLHLSPLTHLGFGNPVEESYVTHPDLLYRLVRRDEMPIARLSLPSPHIPKFKFRSGLTFGARPATTSLKLAANHSKAPATYFPLSTPSVLTTCSEATISARCAPSSHPRTRRRRISLTDLPIRFLLPTLRCVI